MLQAGPLLSLSPSFNSYSSSVGNLAEIAARVVSELRRENSDAAAVFLYEDDGDDDDDPPWLHRDDDDRRFRLHDERSVPELSSSTDESNEPDDDGEFEFAFAGRESPSSPISADEIFLNGQIRPVYPVFGKTLLGTEETTKVDRNDETALRLPSAPESSPPAALPRRRQPLRKLMVEEEWASCSSSEADDLDGLPSGTYCVWAPKNAGDRKKSKSTGTTSTSKRWKLRDLILSRSSGGGGGGKVAGKGMTAETESEEKKMSAPYNKKELFGFLGNVNGLSRNLHPF